MARCRRLLTYAICIALATPPFAYGQNVVPGNAIGASVAQGLRLDGSQNETYARLLIEFPNANQPQASASLANGLLLIRLPRPSDLDPSVFAQKAPQFVAGAALSEDKRTIRVALVQGARLINSRDGGVQALDVVLADAPDPPAFVRGSAPLNTQSAQNPLAANANTAPASGPPKKMINGAAPNGAPRILVETSVAEEFTRVRLTPADMATNLPAHGFARTGDRFAIAMPGQFALDMASLRAQPPKRILDAARHTTSANSALVMDVETGAIVRHRREGRAIVVDVLPAGSNPDAIDALIEAAAARIGAPSEAMAPQTQAKAQAQAQAPSAQPNRTPATATKLVSPPTSGRDAAQTNTRATDPAPSGLVKVVGTYQNGKASLVFPFQTQAPAAIFRRGEAIFVLFATAADFDVNDVAPNAAFSAITPIKGEAVSGVRIVAPPNITASPSVVGNQWRIGLSDIQAPPARNIVIGREQTPDGTQRITADVPDAGATGAILDPVVGDRLLLGLAMGPNAPLSAGRAFLEADLPQTFHGLVVAPKRDDLQLRPSLEGFVLVAPSGLTLSDVPEMAGGLKVTAPGLVDHKTWQLGPMADFTRNLDKMRVAAAKEAADDASSVQKRLDLARFLIAWDLGAEATGVLTQVEKDVSTIKRDPNFMALKGIAQVLQDRGKEGLDTLSQPEVVDDPASQLWAALAAQQSGNHEEALVRFGRGAAAIGAFGAGQRAQFLLANANALLAQGQAQAALPLAVRAQSEASDTPTKLRATLAVGIAQARLGKVEEALANLTTLAADRDGEVATQAAFERALLAYEHDKASLADTIRTLDSLRYGWRGDDLEINLLRVLGELYIKGGDIRSGLTTMTSATSLRTDLPAARLLRDELHKQFKFLFLDGGADGMPPVQALALFYDFKDLAPIGPDGDRMVRGLADRLVALDLLPQATQLLQHQIDKRLDGFPKAQVATDLAAIYLMDRRGEDALKAIWNSRVTQLPDALNAQRRLIEAAALGELGRTEHGLEIIEFDQSSDAARLRTELYLRNSDWAKAADSARLTLPPNGNALEPEAAGEVLRAAIAMSLAGQKDNVNDLAARFGEEMGKTAFAEAFKVVTNPALPDPTTLRTALASVTGGSPYHALMKRLRTRLADMASQQLSIPPDTPSTIASAPTIPPTISQGTPQAKAGALLPDAMTAAETAKTEEATPSVTPPLAAR